MAEILDQGTVVSSTGVEVPGEVLGSCYVIWSDVISSGKLLGQVMSSQMWDGGILCKWAPTPTDAGVSICYDWLKQWLNRRV